MSLSRRLVLALVLLSAVGLLVLAFVSYAALSSYLSDRLDDQASDAASLAEDLIFNTGDGAGPPAFDDPTPLGEPHDDEFDGRGGPDELGQSDPLPGGPDDHGRPDQAGGPLPEGSYAELRNQEGDVISRAFSTDRSDDTPAIPENIPMPSEPGEVVTFDVASESGRGSGYRVAVDSNPDGTVAIVAISKREMEETLERLRTIELLVLLAVLGVLAVLGIWAVRIGLRPLSRIEGTARQIAAGDLSRRVEETDERTEVGRLGSAFNEMLGRLEVAFAEQRASEDRLRRFLADASHELRTPLSSIRGYSELFRLGGAADPDDLSHSMRRIEQESERMSRIVEDLLALARMEEVREAQREQVDLAALVAEIVSDIATANPGRSIAVEADESVRVVGDAEQLRRLVSNLVTNAVVHGGDPIEVRVGVNLDMALLEVRDHGKGLPAGAEQKVFERLWRADPARERTRGGAGLGLAIVEAVALAHGGTVAAENAAGGGAKFTVRLPVAP